MISKSKLSLLTDVLCSYSSGLQTCISSYLPVYRFSFLIVLKLVSASMTFYTSMTGVLTYAVLGGLEPPTNVLLLEEVLILPLRTNS